VNSYKIPYKAKIDLLFLELSGTVVKVTSPRVLSSAKSFLCGACKQTTVVPADHEQFYACPAPTKCDQCSESGHFKPLSVEENAVYMAKDYQEVKLQEKLGNLNMGAIPRSIWVTLDDDLVDRCKPGDDIRVVGVVIRRWQPLGK
jgi:DNA helicase MCM9